MGDMYILCVNNGYSYTAHPKATLYGCSNYAKESLEYGKVYKVIKYIEINRNEWRYSCEFKGKHYLIGIQGVVLSSEEEYEKQFINKSSSKKFPKSGYTKTTDKRLINFLEEKGLKNIDYFFNNNSSIYTGIVWNEKNYWFIQKNSSYPYYQVSFIEKFYKKETITKIKVEKNEKTRIKTNRNCEIQRFNISISSIKRIRGIGIECANSKIEFRSVNCYNK